MMVAVGIGGIPAPAAIRTPDVVGVEKMRVRRPVMRSVSGGGGCCGGGGVVSDPA